MNLSKSYVILSTIAYYKTGYYIFIHEKNEKYPYYNYYASYYCKIGYVIDIRYFETDTRQVFCVLNKVKSLSVS